MEENKELMDTVFDEDEPILPDGWEEGEDLFVEVGDSVESVLSDGAEEGHEQLTENEDGTSEAEDPTTVETEEEGIQGDEGETETEEPDGEPGAEDKPSRRLKLKVNHQEEEVDVNAMSDEDLIALLQKGRAFDALRETENKQKFRKVYQEQIDAGMTEAAAKLIAQNEAGGKAYSLTDEEPAAETPAVVERKEETPAVRDFRAEVEQLKALYPEFKEVPDEVARAAAKGVPLLTAYLAYRDKQSAKTAASLKKENRVLKQNAASAAKAPVTGVTGGGSVTPKKSDPFLKGFDADNW